MVGHKAKKKKGSKKGDKQRENEGKHKTKLFFNVSRVFFEIKGVTVLQITVKKRSLKEKTRFFSPKIFLFDLHAPWLFTGVISIFFLCCFIDFPPAYCVVFISLFMLGTVTCMIFTC